MSLLMELALLGVVLYGTAKIIRSTNRKRAARRSAELAETGSAKFPCRVAWKAGTGRSKFVYGKMSASAEGELTFPLRRGGVLNLPRSDWVHREPSGGIGLVILRYNVPGKGDVRILLNEVDAETVEGLLRTAGSDS